MGCEKKEERMVPDIKQIHSICELSVLKCQYHNVAKAEIKGDGGFLGLVIGCSSEHVFKYIICVLNASVFNRRTGRTPI